MLCVLIALVSVVLTSWWEPGQAMPPFAGLAQWLGMSAPAPTATAWADVAGSPSPVTTPTWTPATSDALRISPQGCTSAGQSPAPHGYAIYSASSLAGARGEVALTFDDGPSPTYTPQILAILRQYGAEATFFVVGRHAQLYPDIVRAELLANNAVGNHTYTHAVLPQLSAPAARWEMHATTSALDTIMGGSCMWLFRPPYGAVNSTVLGIARREGLTTVLWDVDAQDWLRPPAQVIAARIIVQLHSGAIILLHDSAPDGEYGDRSRTVAALPAILKAIYAKGYRAVTLPTLLHDAGFTAETAPGTFAQEAPPPLLVVGAE